jgi:hypothetical protein
MVMRRLLVFAAAGILLIPVTLLREMDDPDHPPARQFADRMEAAFGSVDDGAAEAASFTVEEDGFAGAVINVDIGEREADHNLLVGEHSGDCCVLRWVRFEVPFVARLLPRYECEPGSPAMSFDGARFEARAVNLFSDRPLNWREVLPARVSLAPWFFPAMVVLLFLMLHQAVSLSLVFLRGVPRRAVEVERVEWTD